MDQIADWKERIDKATTMFTDRFDQLSETELNWKPNSDSWSIAQNIDHLITINSSYFNIFEDVRSGKSKVPFSGKIGFLNNLFAKLILTAVKPETTKKIKTFPSAEPSKSHINKDILTRFKAHQDVLKKHIELSADFLQRDTVISSPANKYIVYKLSAAFEIIVTHEFRHLNQATEVMRILEESN